MYKGVFTANPSPRCMTSREIMSQNTKPAIYTLSQAEMAHSAFSSLHSAVAVRVATNKISTLPERPIFQIYLSQTMIWKVDFI